MARCSAGGGAATRCLDDLRAVGHEPRGVILGGGAAHPAWHALLADALALPLRPALDDWLSATGAARLATQAMFGRVAPTSSWAEKLA